jgi:hypothetical protein
VIYHLASLIFTAAPATGISSTEVVMSILASLVVILGGAVAIIRPFGEKAKKRRIDNKNFKIWRDGQPEVKGLFDAVVAAPEQMANMKEHMETQDVSIRKLQSGLTNLTAQVVEGNKATNNRISELMEMLNTGNGGNTNSLGDIMQRQAKRNEDWIDDKKS